MFVQVTAKNVGGVFLRHGVYVGLFVLKTFSSQMRVYRVLGEKEYMTVELKFSSMISDVIIKETKSRPMWNK